MSDYINAIVTADPRAIGRRSPAVNARVGADCVLLLCGVPDDIADVSVRVCPDAADGGFHDFPAARSASGEWKCALLGPAFAREGRGWYEVRGATAGGGLAALCRGPLVVRPFSAGTAVPLDSRRRAVMAIPDENGGMHAIYAVRDDAGAWSFVLGDIDDPATVAGGAVVVGAVSAGGAAVRVATPDGKTLELEDA